MNISVQEISLQIKICLRLWIGQQKVLHLYYNIAAVTPVRDQGMCAGSDYAMTAV